MELDEESVRVRERQHEMRDGMRERVSERKSVCVCERERERERIKKY